MKNIFLALFIILGVSIKAQVPQFAVVRPNGTTYICTSFDSAYSKATGGDYIYLPGGYVTLSSPINKELHIYGAGYNQDSSVVTGHTILNSINIQPGGSHGSITGIYSSGGIQINDSVNQYTISRCQISSINFGTGIITNQPASNISIIETAVLNYINCSNKPPTYPVDIVFLNSIIGTLGNGGIVTASQTTWKGLSIKNCIFFGISYCNFGCAYFFNGLDNASFENCIFFSATGGQNNIGISYSIFRNCITNRDSIFIAPNNTVYNCIYNQAINNTLINQTGNTFDIHNDYHLSPGSPGKNAGTDGTDIGVYGGIFPWVEGGIPANPHIYFKQVAPRTNNNGQLQIQFKVRTGN